MPQIFINWPEVNHHSRKEPVTLQSLTDPIKYLQVVDTKTNKEITASIIKYFQVVGIPYILAVCISFLGIHPTLRQVPPTPHVVLGGEGSTKSNTTT